MHPKESVIQSNPIQTAKRPEKKRGAHLSTIRLRLTPPPNLGGEQPEPLLVCAGQDDPRRLGRGDGDIRRDIDVYRVCVAEFHVQSLLWGWEVLASGGGGCAARWDTGSDGEEGFRDRFDGCSVPDTDES